MKIMCSTPWQLRSRLQYTVGVTSELARNVFQWKQTEAFGATEAKARQPVTARKMASDYMFTNSKCEALNGKFNQGLKRI